MKRYVRAFLGGFLAILAAFGWTVAIAFLISWKYGDGIAGVTNGLALWIFVFLIFALGFSCPFVPLTAQRFQTEALPKLRIVGEFPGDTVGTPNHREQSCTSTLSRDVMGFYLYQLASLASK